MPTRRRRWHERVPLAVRVAAIAAYLGYWLVGAVLSPPGWGNLATVGVWLASSLLLAALIGWQGGLALSLLYATTIAVVVGFAAVPWGMHVEGAQGEAEAAFGGDDPSAGTYADCGRRATFVLPARYVFHCRVGYCNQGDVLEPVLDRVVLTHDVMRRRWSFTQTNTSLGPWQGTPAEMLRCPVYY